MISSVALLLAGASVAAESPPTFRFDIPSEPLSAALRAYGQTAHQSLIFTQNLVDGLIAPDLKGEFSAQAALEFLLKGTGLATERSPSGALMIRKHLPSSTSPAGKRAVAISPVDLDTSAQRPDRDGPEVAEILVTAQKRTERFVDVPMSLSVLDGARLSRNQASTLQDIVDLVPGLQLVATSPIGNVLTIRGISIGAGAINASVATYVDETPYTTEGPFASSSAISPNLDPYDMARVEVLRGPQGTLYGANALAGLLKYVSNAPDPSSFSASALAGGNTVAHGAQGYDVHGMVNLPLSETAAFRLVAGDTRFPGFIDDPNREQQDSNAIRRSLLRASLLLQPSDEWLFRLNATYQELRAGDAGTEDVEPVTLRPVVGEWQQQGAIGQPQSISNGIYNATISWSPAFATFLSSTSFATANASQLMDQSLFRGPALFDLFHVNYGAVVQYQMPVHSFTQEFRVSSPDSAPLQWVAGLYVDNEYADEHEPLYPVDPATHAILTSFEPAIGAYHIRSQYTEYAGFLNAAYRVTPALNLELGGRFSQNNQDYHQVSVGILTGDTNFVTPSSQHVFTYSAALKYALDETTSTYARLATGFVPGGPNDALPGSSLPSRFKSSSTTNYEVGVKGVLARGLLSYDLDVFDINWHDIQLVALVGSLYGITNGGEARSRGLESALSLHPFAHLTVGVSAAYTDARLTSATAIGGLAGDRLPQSPHFSGTLRTETDWPLSQDSSLFGGFNWHYQSNRLSEFSDSGPHTTLPGYSMLNARLGVRRKNYEATVYAKNLGDAHVISSFEPETLYSVGPQSAYVLPPRLIGFTIGAKF